MVSWLYSVVAAGKGASVCSLGSFVRLGISRTKLNGKFLTEYLREALSNIYFDLDLFIFKHHITTVIALP